MALDQKQMYLASQLFVAASKLGLGFDFGKFVNHPAYAAETLAQLAVQAKNSALQDLIALTASSIGSGKTLAAAVVSTPAGAAAPATEITPENPEAIVDRYVGRLR